jgi:glycosyltransferase involved in cell wall biosynthesis
MRLLIYAANLHVGGGVQVAASIISELTQWPDDLQDVTVWASSCVNQNLEGLGFSPHVFSAYEIIDHRGMWARFSRDRDRVSNFDSVLVIFGPHYIGDLGSKGNFPHIVMGFAQAWIIYPDAEVYALLKPLSRCIARFKYFLQAQLFRRADTLVVELNHVKRGLIARGIANPDQIEVIHNCISSIYLNPALWQVLPLPNHTARFRLGFIGRNYPHKNTRVFPKVLAALRRDYQLDVELLVTFTQSEWEACDDDFRSSVVNVGALTMAQCPAFYQSLDAVVFPSMSECFSATPLEALVMKKPLFASDRAFVRDICGEFAKYFDPLDPSDIARVIAAGLCQPVDAEKLSKAHLHSINFSNASSRAKRYLTLLREASIKKRQDKVEF